MATDSVIVVGASAGGVEALSTLVRGLPKDLPAAVLVVLHVHAGARSVLPAVLDKRSELQARPAEDGASLERGVIYVAPSDLHMLVEGERIRLARGPKVNRTRPAIDPLFRSAAQAYGSRVIGVLLSGTLDDGSAGMQAIKDAGGLTIVQDPEDALFPDMPQNALATGAVDHALPVAEIPPLLARLAEESDQGGVRVSRELGRVQLDSEAVYRDMTAQGRGERGGQPSVLSCPDCGGVVWEFDDEGPLRYRCHVGHEYSWQTMRSGQSDAVEEALWRAARALEEQAALNRRIAHELKANRITSGLRQLEAEAHDAERQADVIRQLIARAAEAAGREAAVFDNIPAVTGREPDPDEDPTLVGTEPV